MLEAGMLQASLLPPTSGAALPLPAAFTLHCVLRYQDFQISLVHREEKRSTSFKAFPEKA